VICGGARGDMLFAEASLELGAEVWLLLPLAEDEFLERSVRLPDSNWEQRYFDLRRGRTTSTCSRPRRDRARVAGVSRNVLGVLPKGSMSCGRSSRGRPSQDREARAWRVRPRMSIPRNDY
jgi:hypothetical protein